MRLLLNGLEHETEISTLLELLRSSGIDTERNGIAVAINNVVVPRTDWPIRTLEEGDNIEVITAMQGG